MRHGMRHGMRHSERLVIGRERTAAESKLTRLPRLVAEFTLPLDLCKPQNRTRHAEPWALKKLKSQIWENLFFQAGLKRFPAPLEGVPQVIATRFSSVQPDRYADGAKMAVDCLCRLRKPGEPRLNIIIDDSPRYADVWQEWFRTKPREGFVYIEVRQ